MKIIERIKALKRKLLEMLKKIGTCLITISGAEEPPKEPDNNDGSK